jgi:hypothetical protein
VTPRQQPREIAEPDDANWYGWQTFVSDAISTGLFVAAIQISNGNGLLEDSAPPAANLAAGLGMAGYVAGAPTIHIVHGRPGAATGSVLLRLGLPVVGGLVGDRLATCPPPSGDYGNCGLGEIVVGFLGGIVAASVIDATALSWEDPSPKIEAPPGPTLGFAPVLSSDGKHGELRMFGTF